MIRKMMYAAIAALVMVGCEDNSIVDSASEKKADIPVNISYEDAGISEENHDAKAVVEYSDGSKEEFDLNITENGISGVATDIAEDEVKVSVEVYSADGDLLWKGSDYVERENDSTFEDVNTDLFKVETDGRINPNEKIEDHNCSREKLANADLEKYLRMVLSEVEMDAPIREEFIRIAEGREWTENELLLLEYFVSILSEAHGEQKEYVEWESDTLYFGETDVEIERDSVIIDSGDGDQNNEYGREDSLYTDSSEWKEFDTTDIFEEEIIYTDSSEWKEMDSIFIDEEVIYTDSSEWKELDTTDIFEEEIIYTDSSEWKEVDTIDIFEEDIVEEGIFIDSSEMDHI